MLQWIQECTYLFKLVSSLSSDKYPDVELLDDIVVLFLMFWGTSILSLLAAPTVFPHIVHWGFPFLHIFTNMSFLILIIAIWTGKKWFYLHLPDNLWYWASLHVPVSHLYVFFGKMSVRPSAQITYFAFFLLLGFMCDLYILIIHPII